MSSGARAASVSAISLALVAALCLSLACLAAGRGSSLWSRHSRRSYDFRAGWLAFSSNGKSSPSPLREISYGTAVAGAVSASTLVLSCVLAAVCLTLCLLGKAGGFLAAVAVPAAVLVAAPLCVFQVLMSIFGSKAIQREIGLRWVPWPDVGWCLGIAAALLWALVGCLGCCVPARKRKNAAFAFSSAPATPLASAAAVAGAAAAAPSAPPLARAASSGDNNNNNNRKSTATPFTEGMAAEDAEALGASSRPGSAAAAAATPGGFAKVPSYKLPRFKATSSSGAGGSSSKRSSSSRGGGDASASGSSSVPVAPASAFGSRGGGAGADDEGSPRVSVALPAVPLPEAPAPEALPNPQRLGFFAAVKRSMSRAASSTTTASAEREVGAGV